MTDTLPIGLIGCGAMGAAHAKQMGALRELRLAAACDVDEAKARATALAVAGAAGAGGDVRDVRVFNNIASLLAQPDIPAVLVATPNFTHREIVLAALAAGKAVFCEKPMALAVADCDAMIAAAQGAGRKLMVGQVLRLIPVFAEVRRLVQEGVIGPPRAMRVLRCSARREEGPAARRPAPQPAGLRRGPAAPPAPWRTERAAAGGLLFEVNVHEFDFMRAIMGEAAAVSAMVANFSRPAYDYEDHAIVTIRFRNGGLGVLESSAATAIAATEGLVTGDRGSVHYDWGRNTVAYRQVGGDLVQVPVERDAGRSVQSELASFARWVLFDEPPVVTAEDGRRAVQLAEAAYRAAREQRTISIE